MRPPRLAALALLVAATACRREAPAPVPPRAPAARPAPVDAPPPPWDETPSVTLMSSTPARHPEGSDAWAVTLSLSVHNPSPDSLSIRADAFHVTRDEGAEGALASPNGIEGPTTVAPGARVNVRVTAVFPATPTPPYAIELRFDPAGRDRPLAFPIPSAPPVNPPHPPASRSDARP